MPASDFLAAVDRGLDAATVVMERADLVLCKCGHPPEDHDPQLGCLSDAAGDDDEVCACARYEVQR